MTSRALALALVLVAAACSSTSGTSGAPSAAPKVRPYPLDICLVTGSKLGSMGDAYVIVHGDQEVKFCCRPCVAAFQGDPAKYLAQIPR